MPQQGRRWEQGSVQRCGARTSIIRSCSRCFTMASSLAASASLRSTSRVYQNTSRPFCHLQEEGRARVAPGMQHEASQAPGCVRSTARAELLQTYKRQSKLVCRSEGSATRGAQVPAELAFRGLPHNGRQSMAPPRKPGAPHRPVVALTLCPRKNSLSLSLFTFSQLNWSRPPAGSAQRHWMEGQDATRCTQAAAGVKQHLQSS